MHDGDRDLGSQYESDSSTGDENLDKVVWWGTTGLNRLFWIFVIIALIVAFLRGQL
jgi:hypothetical protein